MSVRLRRVYDPPEPGDGVRVLVAAHVDEWPKGLTPSAELRRWYHAGEGTYEEFTRRYEAELTAPEASELLDHVRELAGKGPVTLLTSAKDPGQSHAAVLVRLLG